jgi:flagellum-specific peptidoglycan hydrolase FlgJ
MKKLVLLLTLLITCFFAKAQNTPKSYIEKYKDAAISIMHDYGIPASVTLAIAMHESASGNSKLARQNNNQFGMKGRHSYKTYDSVLESFEDFARIISKRNLADKFDSFDYKSWAKGIQRGGYASSGKWSTQVLSIIKKFELNSFDEKPALEVQ